MENSPPSSSLESSSSSESSDDDDDDDDDDESYSSLQGEESAIKRVLAKTTNHHPHQFAQHVQRWVHQVPIGLGLCPWAGKSHGTGNLRYVSCFSKQPEQVMELVYSEMETLVAVDDSSKYSTTLLICPFVKEWKEFDNFEKFVTNGCLVASNTEVEEQDKEIRRYEQKRQHFQNKITLVPFHPTFLRWRGLPEGMSIGTVVESHWGMVGSKSSTKASATIIETENKVFGKQKVKIRFHEEIEGRRSEQYVPIDWILPNGELGPPLPDNAMHRAPYPTIHLISNQDLASLSIRDISRVKRKNAQRMMKLGWSGLEKRTLVE
ncbi:unnamed protein product [Cylindrotheca closterium]|uniref:Uncharacterized protein n=1 Tax=Cylindrotheca closterium TaxID=2856 RepID=A0AAD2FSD5_9STRA|nr:unnamed protein product [Cylindrotheca closterium]